MLAIHVQELVVRSPILGQLSFWVKFWTFDHVLGNVINRVSAKLHCFTDFISLCARHYILYNLIWIHNQISQHWWIFCKIWLGSRCSQMYRVCFPMLNAQWSLRIILVYKFSLLAPYSISIFNDRAFVRGGCIFSRNRFSRTECFQHFVFLDMWVILPSWTGVAFPPLRMSMVW